MNHGGANALKYYDSRLSRLISSVYHEHKWDEFKFNANHGHLRKSQQLLMKRVMQLLPTGVDFHLNYIHHGLHFASGKPMQLDIFVPTMNLAFEYQGRQHYAPVRVLPANVETDQEKLAACQMRGITLIAVPYWWDGSMDSLRASVHLARPDLVADPGNGKPIPDEAPGAAKPRKK
eukprot:TRINITY_DN6228_c0_g2_i1.p2 TRINITY_DN6228_c0_g2~~TRINITY_DN6228_c0_g2_i1.p2  ORF type:complete len:176 (+),score=29.60 TRINITY_DN6228_c0_g2_i1:928-1455(+)